MIRPLSLLLPLILLSLILLSLGAALQDPSSPSSAPEAKPLFRFGLVTDVQYADKETTGTRDYRGSAAKLRACVDDWNEQDLAFALQLGDLIDGRDTLAGSHEDLAKMLGILERLEVPVHHVLGNHCFEVPRAELLPTLGLEASWYAIRRQGWRFLVLDSLDLSTCGWPEGTPQHEAATRWLAEHPLAEHPNAHPYNGGVGEVQLEWLREELAAAEKAKERVVVFSHLPILAEAADVGLLLWNHAEVRAVVDAAPAVTALIAGHHHAGGAAVSEGIPHWTMKGMVEQTEGDGDWAVIEVYPDRLEVLGRGRVVNRTLKREPAPAERDG